MFFSFNKKKPRKVTAAEWVLRQDRGLTDKEESEFEQWKSKDIEARKLSEKYQDILDKFDALRIRDIEGMIDPDPGLFAPESEPLRWPRYMLQATAAVAVMAVVCFTILFIAHDPDPELEAFSKTLDSAMTDYYELSDGSTLELNANTEVDYRYTSESRDFWIKSGEAYFTVAKEPERPFKVYVFGSRIRALSTQFNVKFQEDSVELLVTEGVVALTQMPLNAPKSDYDEADAYTNEISANQRTTIFPLNTEPSVPVNTVTTEELDEILAWKPVTLRFSATPLRDVVEAFNQYNSTQLIISDESLGDILIDVTFRSNKLEGFVRLIEATNNVVANRQGDRIYFYERN